MHIDTGACAGNGLCHRCSFVTFPGKLFSEDEVERVGDLQRLFVTLDGKDIDTEAFDQSRVVRRKRTARLAGITARKLFMGSQQHLGAEPLRSLHSAKPCPVEVSPNCCPRTSALETVKALGPVSPVDYLGSCGIHVRFHTHGRVRNRPPYGVDHRQNRNDRLGAGVQRVNNSREHIWRGQTPRGIMDENVFRVTAKFQGCLH